MWALVFGAVRARTAQVVTVFVLSALVTAAAAAGPWWLFASSKQVAKADVAAAPANQRLLSVRRITNTLGHPDTSLAAFKTAVEQVLTIRDADPTLGMVQTLTATVGAADRDAPVDYRDHVCDHLRITGSCPTAIDQAVISQYTADLLGLNVGDKWSVSYVSGAEPIVLTVVGRYEPLDSAGEYWSDPLFAPGNSSAAGGSLDPTFVALSTFGHVALGGPTFDYTTRVPAALLQGNGVDALGARLRTADFTLHDQGFLLYAPTQSMLTQIAQDRDAVNLGVQVGTGQVIVLCWFALGMAGRYTARDRRGDVALLKLRGSTRGRLLRLTIGQHLVPILAALPVGAALGWLFARVFAGPISDPADLVSAWPVVAIALAGGLLALLLAEVTALWAPVAGLLRRVAAGRRGWRGDVVDLVLVAVAVAAVYQAHSGGIIGFALVAPALVALAVAVLIARGLGYAADRGGGGALRAGRLRAGLTAVQISRQPGADRVFALVAVAVAILGTAADGFLTGASARATRADVELGADRVLTVQAANRTALLHAVRQVDPQGRTAMAVVANLTSSPQVLAVDASRLAAVASWRADYGPLPALTTGTVPASATVTGTGVTVSARNPSPGPVALLVTLENTATGLDQSVLVGPFPPGDARAAGALHGCDTGSGCRIVRLDLDAPSSLSDQSAPADPGSSLTVLQIGQQGPVRSILDGAVLGDQRRWRPGPVGPAMTVAASKNALTLTLPQAPADNRAFVVDTPLPLPIVTSGSHPSGIALADPELNPFGGTTVPVRVTGTTRVLPVVGTKGILIDLAAAQQVLAGGGNGGTSQVWLAKGAPDSVVDRLRAAGLIIISDQSQSARRGELAMHGPELATRYELFTALIGLLLAAAALTVSASVERVTRAVELGALRVQGLSGRVAAIVGYAGYAALIVLGVVAGVVATVVAYALAYRPAPAFNDGWAVLPSPGALRPVGLLVTAVVALVVLGVLWWLAAAPLARRLRGEPR